jgi:hypothetical protein
MRSTVLTLTILSTATLAAQQPAAAPAAPWTSPAGWTVHLDAKDAGKAPADTKFQTMGQGFHVTSGPAAIYYRASDQAKGNYTVKATFGQRTKPAMGHSEAYGVFIGGTNVTDAAKQQYMYLVVRDNGMFYVAHRAGPDVHPMVPWTAHDAVKKAAENGSATNEVAMQVAADSLHMMVNGQRVKSFAKTELHGFVTDGQFGMRVNHGLNVHIANFGVQQ